jgi:phosphoglycerol transferase MdoB-like AlkP superfamily enzyme
VTQKVNFIKLFVGILGLFVLHRFFCWQYLVPEFYRNVPRSVVIGLLSDVWVSWIVALLFYSLVRLIRHGHLILLMILLMSLACHQAYVSYFKSQMLPFHFIYLLDAEFVAAQMSSLFNLDVILSVCLGMMLIYLVNFLKFKQPSPKFLLIGSVVALGLHVLQIKYKVQWFVHENLQLNVVENIVIKYMNQVFIYPLSEDELSQLKARYSGNFSNDSVPPQLATSDEITENLRIQWEKLVSAGEKPLFLFLLMEGQREIDRPLYGPELTSLSARGILFEQLYSTGTVTRGGQEAVFCGYPGSMKSSTMRNHPEIRLDCIPRLVDQSGFWIHGGMGLFDAQRIFWEKQGIKNLISQEDFSEEIPVTPWGISDLSLMKYVVPKIQDLTQENKNFSYGLVLTITNHVPWVLPSDAPQFLKERLKVDPFPALTTSSYADLSVAKLVEALKTADIWRKTILVISGDHGHDTPSEQNSSREERLTRVVGVISGGIVEQEIQPTVISTPVSQKDLGFFAAQILKVDLKAPLAQSPFSMRHLPVFSDLGDAIYFPESKVTVKLKDIEKVGSRRTSEELFAAWYQNLIQEWSLSLGIN